MATNCQNGNSSENVVLQNKMISSHNIALVAELDGQEHSCTPVTCETTIFLPVNLVATQDLSE